MAVLPSGMCRRALFDSVSTETNLLAGRAVTPRAERTSSAGVEKSMSGE